MNQQIKTTIPLAVAIGTLALAAGSAHAAVTYVDAEKGATGNTYATGGSLSDTSWRVASTTAADQDHWSERDFANEGNVFQARSNGTSMPELTTEITGLADGDYAIYSFFWDAGSTNQWTISTGLTSGALTEYSFDGAGNTTAPVLASSLTYDGTDPLFTEGTSPQIMYAVNVGTATVTGGSTVNVYIDNFGGDSVGRTWYDGVGYEAVPEPSSTALLGLGGLALILRRRK